MEIIFYYLAIILCIVVIPTSVFISIMGGAWSKSIIKGILITLGIMLLIAFVPISITYLALSVFEWLVNYCRDSYQIYLVSGIGAILILRGLTKKKSDLINKTLKIILKLFYTVSGLALVWYGINYGYGQLNWNSVLIFMIISGTIECITGYIDWKKKGNSFKGILNKNKLVKDNENLSNNTDEEN